MKISIVTPAYNMENYISETISSILAQKGDFDIEYIVVNDGSTDGTEKIILDTKNRLEKKITPILCNSFELKYLYQPNQGMYSAINNGFKIATGDVYAWIGGDDLYRPNTGFSEIVKWFSSHPESLWVKGMCGLIDVDGNIIREGRHRIFYQDWIAQGIYGRESYFIEQESVFWRPDLWKKVAPIPGHLRSAGDYWLWTQFAKHTSLDSIPVQVAYFRIRPGQISSNKTKYKQEQCEISPKVSMTANIVRVFSILFNKAPLLSPLWNQFHKIIFLGRKRSI
jgi:glycosyltransferase involved in cell wall biosynthesis